MYQEAANYLQRYVDGPGTDKLKAKRRRFDRRP